MPHLDRGRQSQRIDKEGGAATPEETAKEEFAKRAHFLRWTMLQEQTSQRELSGAVGRGSGRLCPISIGDAGGAGGYKRAAKARPPHLPGRGLSMISKVDGLEEPAPLHHGPGDFSTFLREAYTS
jgi:hypothetical protein